MTWVNEAVSEFGAACKAKLAGPGDREAAIRSPLEALVSRAGEDLGLTVTPYDEVRDTERSVRPDYAISVNGAITGYLEAKKPGASIDPEDFHGHDKQQWERQRDLPNLIYTNGREWRLWRDGQLIQGPVRLTGGPLERAGSSLEGSDALESLLTDFLRWHPAPITSVGALVRAIAPLTRLLRGEVLDQLAFERAAVRGGATEALQPFTGLARDWRAMLFPTASDEVFADGYAQAVTFALLLARTENIDLVGSLHEVGAKLNAADHSLMGKALQLLTDDVAADFRVTLDLLVRVVGAVNWPRVRRNRDTYLHLYEHFLDEYDPELRKQSGSYYTPRDVVEQMARLAEEALTNHLDKPKGFADPAVVTVDPAMGTGTYLHAIIDRVARNVERHEGPGMVPAAISALATRLIGFELQMGPYAVAELRASDLMRALRAKPPKTGMRLYVTNSLDDPHSEVTQLGSGLELLAQSRRKANKVKAEERVTVVIGNPPYKELAVGDGGWVELGGEEYGKRSRPILEDFFAKDAGRFKAKLKNLYIYFWRWATWKVWESTPSMTEGDAGIVCFISTSGYLAGPGFTAMREYLRRHASEGWIIDLTPEGQTPDVPTRIFPGVRQPLAIGLFVRRPGTSLNEPAIIRYRAVHGRQDDKFAVLANMSLDDDGWRPTRSDWTAPLTPAAKSGWDDYPAVADILPWYSPGVFPTRTWVYSPSPEVLRRRWARLVGAANDEKKSELFKEGRDANLTKTKQALPGTDTYRNTTRPIREATGPCPTPVRVGHRSFDRQWLIPDSRLMDMPRRDLWAARISNQIFVIEQHSQAVEDGPGLVFSALIPDFHHFNNRGGRTLPLLNPNGRPNLAPGLADALAAMVGGEMFAGRVSAEDVLAYIAAITAHPAYTAKFADELTTPGIRIPITAEPSLWSQAVELGRYIVWTHTFGAAFADTDAGRPPDDIRYPDADPRRVLNHNAVTEMPETLSYDTSTGHVRAGTGEWGPVPEAVFDYTVGGVNTLKSWFKSRKADPGGRKGSPLDDIHPQTWPGDWSVELTDLLSVLKRLVEVQDKQATLLDAITSGPLLSRAWLGEHGVRWPATAADRKPRYTPIPAAPAVGQLEFDS